MAQHARAERNSLAISRSDRKFLDGILTGLDRRLATPAKGSGPATLKRIRPFGGTEEAGKHRRDSRRIAGADVPQITEVRIAGERFRLVDVSRHGVLLHGSMRAQIDRTLRVLAVMSDGSRAELKARVARAFVAGLSKDHVTFGVGLRLSDAIEWLDFDEDEQEALEPADAPADDSQAAFDVEAVSNGDAANDEWVETDSGSGLVVPKHTIADDEDAWDPTDCWTLV